MLSLSNLIWTAKTMSLGTVIQTEGEMSPYTYQLISPDWLVDS